VWCVGGLCRRDDVLWEVTWSAWGHEVAGLRCVASSMLKEPVQARLAHEFVMGNIRSSLSWCYTLCVGNMPSFVQPACCLWNQLLQHVS
jgi:hypothetical protein